MKKKNPVWDFITFEPKYKVKDWILFFLLIVIGWYVGRSIFPDDWRKYIFAPIFVIIHHFWEYTKSRVKVVSNFTKDFNTALKRVPENHTSRHIGGIPVGLLYIFSPLFIIITLLTWFDLRIFLGTIVILVLTFLSVWFVVHMERNRAPEYSTDAPKEIKRKVTFASLIERIATILVTLVFIFGAIYLIIIWK